MNVAELIVDCNNEHGEGVFWDAMNKKIWWTDIFAKKIWSFDPETASTASFDMPSPVCCFAPRARGGFIIAFNDRVSLFDLDKGELECIHQFEPSNPNTRLNDGRTDRDGNFIAGGMNDVTFEADSSVIRVGHDHSVETLIDNVACANSICFSPKGDSMYFADTPSGEIIEYAYQPCSPSLVKSRQLMSFNDEPGIPDGSCVDSEGGVWNAEWEGGRVVRINSKGEVDFIVQVPVCKPTCCAFGGENLDTLFITTSRLLSSDHVIQSEPGTGGLFAIKPGFTGVVDSVFRG
ncbi:SMP-30/gluconolactonase/LRE family protein [Enterovibrio calviensis]|uniref:SMP-30/gluconolactonase/LRE family protein n=1 Tax=Enterovibrio calviensis TaxID=91359 RepID=UPI000482DE03|nr:SMP-30/gluconolactonase/LRE family protein [Enterovibrio calviensis]